ncbi:uncharacterized protein LOC125302185 isoform X1 [Alosa alosa]|uniref:uncharacterized protein LOC125302185 isoform X1 n=1 Tax=Alosa alosa TaxID=278164 RepID=UPI0020154F12|nr:uncharacterized protein LOC125302185 isoform X1 [Alosa alosa]
MEADDGSPLGSTLSSPVHYVPRGRDSPRVLADDGSLGSTFSFDGSSLSSLFDSPLGSPAAPPHDETEQVTNGGLDALLTARSNVSKAEALLMLMSYIAKHNITGVQLTDLLSLINQLFGHEVLPRSKYLFNKVFNEQSKDISFQIYCQQCKHLIGTSHEITNRKHCVTCGTAFETDRLNGGSFFLSLPLDSQIQAFLENSDVSSHLNYRFIRTKSNHNAISDIYDGVKYKALAGPGEILSNPNNLSYTFNSDGSPLFKSAKFSMWPIHIMINELPPAMRSKHLILAGLWCGPREPLMEIFLKPFVEQAKKLANVGVTWRNQGELVKSKLVGLCCSVDSKARPQMLNTTQFNGYYGCSFCLHPGEIVGRVIKYPVSADSYEDCTNEMMLQDMELAGRTGRTVRGVKGPTPLINLPYFDVVWGFVPDYMHATLLGVSRQITKLLVDSTSCREPYYVGSPAKLRVIDARIVSIKPPHLITRLPRKLSDRIHWKATEWRNWLLFYCVPCLSGFLPKQYLGNLCLLVSALFLLLQDEISSDDIGKAETLLLEFTYRFQMLYGESEMTFNVHLLSHLGKSVRLWGPLWAHSAFPFESANGSLLKLVSGTKAVAQQIANKYLAYSSIPSFALKYSIKDQVSEFCAKMNNFPTVKKAVRCDDCVLLDNGMVHILSPEEQILLAGYGLCPLNEVVVHKRMLRHGLIFTSKEYTLSRRRKECYVELTSGRCGEIEKIIYLPNDDVVLIFKPFYVVHAFPLLHPYGFVPHIKLVDHFEPSTLVPVEHLKGKRMCFSVSDNQYMCSFPNTHERD